MTGEAAPETPVLVGVGVASRRDDDLARLLEPMDLMLEAVAAAGRDVGACGAEALAGAQAVAVPRGRWSYRNPSGEIARAIGAADAVTILSSVGVLQQSLISDACERIARGERHTELVVGGDAGHRLLRAKIAGVQATERAQDDDPQVKLEPAAELRHPAEVAAGLKMPVGLYAMIESAARARSGLGVEAHRDRLARLGESFAAIAADNPHAWDRRRRSAAEVRDAAPSNPMQAFPYTRAHCSSWNVDQAAALLLCSARRAAELGIDRSRWIFPVAAAESNAMTAVSARPDLAACLGAAATGRAVLAAAGLTADEVDLVELYSCFPIAVAAYAEAVGLPLERALTVTGGMAFAGGPYNNYLLQATCRAAELMREGRGRTALVSCVSGILTKQAFALWSTSPPPAGFARLDVTAEVARGTVPREVRETFSGEAVVAGCTVVHGRGRTPRAVAIVDTPDGARALATSEDEAIVHALQCEEWVGRAVRVEANALVA